MARLPDLPPRDGGREVAPPGSGSRSLSEMLDKGLLVVVSVVAVLIVLKVIGIIAGTIFFVAKLLVLAAVLYGVLRLVLRKR